MTAEIKRSRKSSDEGEDAQEDPQVIPDSVLLQEIMPEEVWELVSKIVLQAGSKDHQNLVNSSQFFQNLRASQRTTYLLEQVYLLVVITLWKKEGIEGIPMADVLNCRRVCKEWNTVIDKVVPQFSSFEKELMNSAGRYDINEYCRIGSSYHFYYPILDDSSSVQDFIVYFDPTHTQGNPINGRNPFIWRKFGFFLFPSHYDDSEDEAMDLQLSLEGVSSMLAKYGHHVHEFQLETENSVLANLSLFREWLVRMPNLKFLHVENEDNDEVDIGERNLEDYPFPKLRFLEKIKIEYLQPEIVNQLLRLNNHISNLFVEDPKDTDVFIIALPNLKEFGTDVSPDDIVEILASPQIQWPLESLELGWIRSIGCAPLFPVICDKFTDTLVSLNLRIRKGIDDVDGDVVDGSLWRYCKDCRLDLPKLKTITLDFGERPVCLDFLLPMKNKLEKISASCQHGEYELPPTTGHIIQYVDFEERMLESNIWAVFKELKEIKVIGPRRHDPNPKPLYYFRKDWMLINYMPDFSDSLHLIFLLPSTL